LPDNKNRATYREIKISVKAGDEGQKCVLKVLQLLVQQTNTLSPFNNI
jgi:hypothetical protein